MTKAKKKVSPSSTKNKSATESSADSRPEDGTQQAAGAQSVDKIREILFGNQMQDYEKRFARLEDGLHKKITELRDTTTKRLDSLETFIKNEIEALSDRLKNEQSLRDASVKKLSTEFKDSMQLLSKSVEQLQEKQSKDTRDFRQQLLDASKELSSEIVAKHDQADKALKQAFEELNEDKVARTTLSDGTGCAHIQ